MSNVELIVIILGKSGIKIGIVAVRAAAQNRAELRIRVRVPFSFSVEQPIEEFIYEFLILLGFNISNADGCGKT